MVSGTMIVKTKLAVCMPALVSFRGKVNKKKRSFTQ